MKKFYLFPLLTSLFLAGCSQEEPVPGSEDVGNGFNTSYMAVNLVSSDITGSRASAGYEDGTEDENKVTKVRFYFFNGAGGAVDVKLLNGSYVNYYDWTPGEGDHIDDSGNNNDIESKLNAVIVINTKDGDKIPQRMAAVLNPPTIGEKPLLPDVSMSLTTLKEKVADFATANLTTKGSFVMFNSVYGGRDTQISTTAIENKHLCKNQDEAIKNPVTIYVERSVAKVSVTLDDKIGFDTDNKLLLKDKDGNNLTVGDQQVYLKLEGWDLTAETSEGRLVKKINPGWSKNWDWNGTYRSFWAINSMTAENRYDSYNSINKHFGVNNALYTNENAQTNDIDATGNAKEKTKVILKGKLCKADGSAFTIVRHLGIYYADDANLSELKKSILNQLNASGNTYYYQVEDGRNQIEVADIKIVIADQKENENSKNNCYVYAQLTDAAKEKTWYSSSDKNETTTVDANTINENLKNDKVVDRALVWNNGMTYYYYAIKHLGDEIGVVRNHVYKTNVTKIAGLGTPVYDPDEVIYPEIPDPNDHYIAAQINILSWRIVTDDYELKW